MVGFYKGVNYRKLIRASDPDPVGVAGTCVYLQLRSARL